MPTFSNNTGYAFYLDQGDGTTRVVEPGEEYDISAPETAPDPHEPLSPPGNPEPAPAPETQE